MSLLIQIIADTHTHSSACDHAFSTIEENAREAARQGLRFLGVTEHTGTMAGAPSVLYFRSILKNFPDEFFGVKLLKGCEVNIIDRHGGLDLDDRTLGNLHWVIASMHEPTFPPIDLDAHTEAWLAVARNPLVDVIGHCGNPRYAFDHEKVIPEFAKHRKIVEINSHSFVERRGSEVECPKIARLCAEHGVRVVVSSDAHHYSRIGSFSKALEALREIDFPHELILNADYDRFVAAIGEITGKSWA